MCTSPPSVLSVRNCSQHVSQKSCPHASELTGSSPSLRQMLHSKSVRTCERFTADSDVDGPGTPAAAHTCRRV